MIGRLLPPCSESLMLGMTISLAFVGSGRTLVKQLNMYEAGLWGREWMCLPAFLTQVKLGLGCANEADPSAWLVIFSSITEFCLLQGKHGGFEQQRRSNSVLLYPLPFPEFAFWDMPDAGQGLSAQDKPLSVLKQGTVIGWGMVS